MANDNRDEIFEEFDFIYRHRQILKEKELEAARMQKEKEDAEAAQRAAAAKLLENKQPENTKKKPEKSEKNKAKKPPKKLKTEEPDNKNEKKRNKKSHGGGEETKKIHPEYGKPYKNDTDRDRKRIVRKQRQKIEKEHKEAHEKVSARIKKENAAERSAARRVRFTRAAIYFLISAAVAAVLFFSSLAVMKFVVGYTKKVEHKNISYTVGSSSSTTRVAYTELIKDGVVYICGDDIVSLCGFTVTGNEKEVKYISPDSGNDTVLFYAGSDRASVNRNMISLQSPTFYKNGRLYIPMSFFTDYATGLVCEYKAETEEKRAEINVYKKILNEFEHKVTGVAALYEPVTFRLKAAVTTPKIDENVLNDDIEDAVYKVDVTEFEDAINPPEVYGYISVINREHRTEGTFAFDDLVPVVIQSPSVEEPVMLRSIAARALEAMFLEVRGIEGYERFNVYSGYHTFENSEEDDPSLDESLLGLSVDAYFMPKDATYGNTNTYKWFVNNAYKYGFIVRYPRDKTEQTGVSFRPWTLRYVGRYAATKMHEQNLCLEEFIEQNNLERVLTVKKTVEQ